MGSRGSLVMAISCLVLFAVSLAGLVVGISDAWWQSVMFGILSACWFKGFTSARRGERQAKLARRALPPRA